MAVTLEPLVDEEEAPLSVLTADALAAIQELRADARAAAEATPSSERAYAADWRFFSAFDAGSGANACRPGLRLWHTSGGVSRGSVRDTGRPGIPLKLKRSP